MSTHARPTSADFAAENHFHGDDKRTLLHDAEPDAEPRSESDDRGTSQQRQVIQLPNGREPRKWISEKEWADYIEEDPNVRGRLSSVVSIFRVPKFLKDTKKEAYVPQRVSLGPHHHGSTELPPMGHHKGRALNRMKKRFNTNRNLANDPNNKDFAYRAKEEILKLEKEIRDSYGECIDCDGDTLAMMLSLDGCFILEVLRTLGGDELSLAEAGQCYDPIFGEKKIEFAASDILNDILMLENQIPLIVLRKLLELELDSAVNVEKMLLKLLVDGTSVLFKPFHHEEFDIKQPVQQQFHHLLGFLHAVIVSPSFDEPVSVDNHKCSISIKCCSRQCIRMLPLKNKAQDDVENIPRAVELRKAGIKFKRCKGIKEIKFESDSATFFLTGICITDNTEIVFRNLIAFEMCQPLETHYVSGYVNLMDDLIDSQQDVALLRRMGVLTDRLGSDKEVAGLFNGLCKEVTVNRENVFDEERKKVNAHYKNKIKVQIAQLVQAHFSSPWKALALAAAIAILFFTAVQAIFSIIPVYN